MNTRRYQDMVIQPITIPFAQEFRPLPKSNLHSKPLFSLEELANVLKEE